MKLIHLTWITFTLLVIYNILDIWHTYFVIQLGVKEWNPVINYLGDIFGMLPTLIVFKSIWLYLLGHCIFLIYKKDSI